MYCGQVHVNGMENFWSLFEGFSCMEPTLLLSLSIFSRYVDEQVFRYNNRNTKQQYRNHTICTDSKQPCLRYSGRRLTYSDLTGKSDSPHHAPTGTGQTAQAPPPSPCRISSASLTEADFLVCLFCFSQVWPVESRSLNCLKPSSASGPSLYSGSFIWTMLRANSSTLPRSFVMTCGRP